MQSLHIVMQSHPSITSPSPLQGLHPRHPWLVHALHAFQHAGVGTSSQIAVAASAHHLVEPVTGAVLDSRNVVIVVIVTPLQMSKRDKRQLL
jgi:hypothetical protein